MDACYFYQKAKGYFDQLKPEDFEQRVYLYYGAKADYYFTKNNLQEAITYIDYALEAVTNVLEKEYLQKKKAAWLLEIG